MTELNSLASPVYVGPTADTEGLYSAIKPVRYRYVMTYLHKETVDGVVHQPGEVIAVLPMTSVTYTVGMYAGTDMSGDVYLPGVHLDLMAHPPSNDYDRWPHPDQQGETIGSQFKCGNRALYVMRNEKVVWGGILWSRNYSSGSPTMSISGISWDGYIYYRWLRRTIKFAANINMYTIWYAAMKQTLTDFTWDGEEYTDSHGVKKYRNSGFIGGEADRITRNAAGKQIKTVSVYWTGITRGLVSNAPTAEFKESWPNNSPNIELPPPNLKLYKHPNAATEATKEPIVATKEWRGYDMLMVGSALEEWADTETIDSIGGGKRFEYKVVCWFDDSQQRFRQRYVFGRMSYKSGHGPTTDEPIADGIESRLLGANSQSTAKGADNQLVFDFPGSIASWSLGETMDAGATRVVVSDNQEKSLKHVEYAVDELLDVPGSGSGAANRGGQGWLLYDQVAAWDITSNIIQKLFEKAKRLLQLYHVPVAQQLSDLSTTGTGQTGSIRSTTLSVSLYQEPTLPFPDFELGDWAAFAITDPFYGGTMYLVRRIVGYTVTVVPDMEGDYSHEQIELELTDDNQVEVN
jgi:hypothetical protein